MKVLLIDCSSKQAGYSLADETGILFQKFPEESNADTLVYSIKKGFEETGYRPGDIDFVSLSNGPGSFTGLRIASAIAKGICLNTGSKLVEICTLDIIANAIKPDLPIVPVIDSKMRSGEMYFAEYEKKDGALKRISDYQTDVPADINTAGKIITARGKIDFEELFGDINFAEISIEDSMKSQFELTMTEIGREKFSDVSNSQPFYFMDFQPISKNG